MILSFSEVLSSKKACGDWEERIAEGTAWMKRKAKGLYGELRRGVLI
jgi:hypothetical protein